MLTRARPTCHPPVARPSTARHRLGLRPGDGLRGLGPAGGGGRVLPGVAAHGALRQSGQRDGHSRRQVRAAGGGGRAAPAVRGPVGAGLSHAGGALPWPDVLPGARAQGEPAGPWRWCMLPVQHRGAPADPGSHHVPPAGGLARSLRAVARAHSRRPASVGHAQARTAAREHRRHSRATGYHCAPGATGGQSEGDDRSPARRAALRRPSTLSSSGPRTRTRT